MNQVKKVLILAYDFPPFISVGGLRPYNWFLEFEKHKLHPIIITRQWDDVTSEHAYIKPSSKKSAVVEHKSYGTIIKAPYFPNISNKLLLKFGTSKFKSIRRIITGIIEILQFFLPIGPKYTLYESANDYLNNHPVDIIISTGDPFVLFHYAQKLSKKHSIPWVADYRDPWSGNVFLQKNKILSKIFQKLEKKIIQHCSTITTVDEALIPFIQHNHTKPIHIIRNGFENKLLTIKSPILNHDTFNIAFIGTLYPWHPIEQSIQIFHEIAKNNNVKIQLNFFGLNLHEDSFFEEINSTFFSITYLPKMSNLQLAELLVHQHAFLLFNDFTLVGTKIYDYIALKRPILFCFDNEKENSTTYFHQFNSTKRPQKEIILNTKSGFLLKDEFELKEKLQLMCTDYDNSIKDLQFKHIEFYSRQYQTKLLAETIHSIVDKNMK